MYKELNGKSVATLVKNDAYDPNYEMSNKFRLVGVYFVSFHLG